MSLTTQNHRTPNTRKVDEYLLSWVEAFLIDRKAGVTNGTSTFYSQKLKQFTNFCEGQALINISQISPTFIQNIYFILNKPGTILVAGMPFIALYAPSNYGTR